MSKDLLDEINRKLILLLEEDPKLTDAALARKLHLAQSTVASRRDRLAKRELVIPRVGLNAEEIGLQTGIVEITTTDPETVLEWAKRCPLFINASKSITGNRLSMFFVGEDAEAFHDIIDGHLLKIDGVSDLRFFHVLRWEKGFFATLDLTITPSSNPPCGKDPFCTKCPANPSYSGNVWRRRIGIPTI
jgi:DNA-binding Lrp family transcriptional regulator